MAAHVLNILREISEGNIPLNQVKAACSMAQGMDSLDYNHWIELYYATDKDSAISTAKRILPCYEFIWNRLDKPVCCEEWRERFYMVHNGKFRNYTWKRALELEKKG